MTDIDPGDAARTLISTASLNRPLGLGSPYSSENYDIQTALRLLDRSTRVRHVLWRGQAMIEIFLPGHGWHGWFVHDRPIPNNPWS
jgi:hypothetical protein